MTEIPEHLLKRSKSAKSARTAGGDSGATDAASTSGGAAPSAAPVAASPAAPATAAPLVPTADLPNLDPAPEPPRPEPRFVTAAKARRKIPVWALPVVAALPIWAVSYAGTLQQPEVEDPLFIEGALFYSGAGGCAGCHSADGSGGSGYPLSDDSVLETFPEPIDQMVHVARGSATIQGQEYGADRADGRRVSGTRGQMPPQQGQISQVQLEMIVFHERAVLSGEDTSAAPYQEWMEHMREAYESGDASEIDLELLLACANPEITPEATGAGSTDEAKPCPGPHAEKAGEGEAALGG